MKEDLWTGIQRLRRQMFFQKLGFQISPLQQVHPSHNFIKRALDQAVFIKSHFNTFGKLSASILVHQFFDPFLGHDSEFHMIYADVTDPTSFAWLMQTIDNDLPELNHHSVALLPACYQQVLPSLRRKGFGVEALALAGSPRIALDSLDAHHKGDRQVLADHGLRIHPFRDPTKIGEVAKLRSEVFAAQKEFCIFYHNPGVDDVFNQFTLDRINTGRQWDIRQGDKLCGFFGFGLFEKECGGKSANMDFAVLPHFQGIGLGWLAYRVMLEEMIKEKVILFTGATSNPAVIKMGKVMLRPLHDLSLMHRDLCPSLDRFQPYIRL